MYLHINYDRYFFKEFKESSFHFIIIIVAGVREGQSSNFHVFQRRAFISRRVQ